MEPSRLAVGLVSSDPFAASQHLRLVRLLEALAAVLAFVANSAGPVLFPFQLRPLQPLHDPAAGHFDVVATLIRKGVFRLNTAEVFDRWRAGQQDLAPRKRRCSALCQRYRVALTVNV